MRFLLEAAYDVTGEVKLTKRCSLNQWLNLQLVWSYPLIVIFTEVKEMRVIFHYLIPDEQCMFYRDPFTMTVHAVFHCESVFYHICIINQKEELSYLNCLLRKAVCFYHLPG